MGLTTALMVLVGAAMVVVSLFYRSDEAPPIASLNPRKWTPIWKQQSHYVGPGYFLMIYGFGVAGLGLLLRFVFLGWDSWHP